jgi:hypothetical protein
MFPSACTRPETSLIIFRDAVDDIVEQAVADRKGDDAIAIDETEAVAQCADPQQAITIFVQRIVSQGGRIVRRRADHAARAIFGEREDRFRSVDPRQRCRPHIAVAKNGRPRGRRDPQRTGAIPVQRTNIVGRQPTAGRPGANHAIAAQPVQSAIAADPEIAVRSAASARIESDARPSRVVSVEKW